VSYQNILSDWYVIRCILMVGSCVSVQWNSVASSIKNNVILLFIIHPLFGELTGLCKSYRLCSFCFKNHDFVISHTWLKLAGWTFKVQRKIYFEVDLVLFCGKCDCVDVIIYIKECCNLVLECEKKVCRKQEYIFIAE